MLVVQGERDSGPGDGGVIIRPEGPGDRSAIRRVHVTAFAGTIEADIVERLHADGLVVVSLVAERAGAILGHVLFSRLPVETDKGIRGALALAPMAVIPEEQRQGTGTALVRAGLARCRDLGEALVVVLGHPEYYPRFGFSAALGARLHASFGGDAFMALELTAGAIRDFSGGTVRYPAAFGLDG